MFAVCGATLACGRAVKQSSFPADQQAALCDRVAECSSEEQLATFDLEDCYANVPAAEPTTTDTGGCEFDRRAAADCLDAIDAAPCGDVLAPYFTPDECAGVCA
jgi:hypothetical protein